MDHPSQSLNKFFVYILRSLVDGTFYTGSTQDVDQRLKQHNAGRSTYTKKHRPYELMYTESFETRYEAEVRERKIKKNGNIKNFLKSRILPTHSK